MVAEWEKEIAKEAEAKMKSTLKQNTASSNLNERSADPIRTAAEAAKMVGTFSVTTNEVLEEENSTQPEKTRQQK